jgi:hypothetical protein
LSLVAFAGTFPKALDVDDADVPAAAADQAGVLKRAGHEAGAGSGHAQHLCQELLRERQVVAVEEVAAL